MTTIYLPTMAAFKGDVETTFSLLERTAKKEGYIIGLEVIGKPEHFRGPESQETLEKIKENLLSVARGARFVVHGFSGERVYTEGIADMRTDTGKELLGIYTNLAKEIGADLVHVHAGAGYTLEMLGPAIGRIIVHKKEGIDQVRENLVTHQKLYADTCKFGIENLPTPSMGDVDKNPDTVWSDCVESVEDCMDVVRGSDLRITFDTAHYAANRGIVEGLVTPVRVIGNNLGHVHISDVSGYWVPYRSTWKEGVIPGKGNIGEDRFRQLLRYLRDYQPHVGLEIEVANTDFKNPVESEESIRRVLNWLQ